MSGATDFFNYQWKDNRRYITSSGETVVVLEENVICSWRQTQLICIVDSTGRLWLAACVAHHSQMATAAYDSINTPLVVWKDTENLRERTVKIAVLRCKNSCCCMKKTAVLRKFNCNATWRLSDALTFNPAILWRLITHFALQFQKGQIRPPP